MTIRLTKPQGDLLAELKTAGDKGLFKSQSYGPACALVRDGLARWKAKYFGGTGTLVITEDGARFGT